METGTIQQFNPTAGIGFITPDDGSADLLVHFTHLSGDTLRCLKPGDRVSYQVVMGRRGPEVTEVYRVGSPLEGSLIEERGTRYREVTVGDPRYLG